MIYSNKHVQYDHFAEFLNKLYHRGFYRTLSFSNWIVYISEEVHGAISPLPQLEVMSTYIDSMIDVRHWSNLKELKIKLPTQPTENAEELPKCLPKLEQITFCEIQSKALFPFMRHSKKLKIIKVFHLFDGVLDIEALNKERKMLGNAGQVTIYELRN